MKTSDIKTEIRNGNTIRARRAVRNALRTMVVNAMRAGFSADCDFDNLIEFTFTDNAVLAKARGFISCKEHVWSVAVPFVHIV